MPHCAHIFVPLRAASSWSDSSAGWHEDCPDNTDDALHTAVHVALEDDRDDAQRIQATLSTRREQRGTLATGKEKELYVHSFGPSRTIYHRKFSL